MGINILETIGKIFRHEENAQTTCVHNHACHEHIPMVNEKNLEKEGNKDNIHICSIHNKKRNEIYNRLESICAEHRMDLDHLKEINFLEEICGMSLDSLTNDEIRNLFSALDGALNRDWKVFWKQRDKQDTMEILHAARRQYNRQQVNGTLFGQVWSNFRTEGTLQEELLDTGIIDKNTNLKTLNDEEFKLKVREYFTKEIIGETENCSDKKLHRKYNRARKQFVYFVNKFESRKEKELLAAAIDEMDSANKAKLTELLINSCGCDSECRGHVAKSVYNEVDTTKKDAFGKNMTQEDATKFYSNTFGNMFKEDATSAIQEMQQSSYSFIEQNGDKIKEIKQKLANGDVLTPEETDLLNCYNNKIVAQSAGATVGIPQNINFTHNEAKEIVNDIMNKAKDLGFDTDVINSVSDYVAKNPEKFSRMSQKEFIQIMDEITVNKYSEISAKRNKNATKQNYKKDVEKNSETKNKEISERNIKNKEIEIADTESKEEANENTSNTSNTSISTYPEEFRKKSKTHNLFINSQNTGCTKYHTKNEDCTTKENHTDAKIKPKDFNSYVRAQGKTNGLTSFIEDYGTNKALAEAITNLDMTNENMVKKLYKQEDSTDQLKIIKNSGTALKKPLEWSKDSTILKLEGKILSCHFATKIAEDTVEEIKEENKKQTC